MRRLVVGLGLLVLSLPLSLSLSLPLPALAADWRDSVLVLDGGAAMEARFVRLPGAVAAASIVWPRGAAWDPPGVSGAASMAARMLDEGAGGRDRRAFAEALDLAGATLTAATDRGSFVVSLTAPQATAEAALALLLDALTAPRYEAEAFARAKARAQGDIAQARTSPSAQLRALFAKQAYAKPWATPALGDAAGLARMTPQSARAHALALLAPAGASVVFAGTWSQDQAQGFLDAWREASAAGREASRGVASLLAPAVPRFAGPAWLELPTRAPREAALFGFAPPTWQAEDLYALAVAVEIIGGGTLESRLNRVLRGEAGLVYGTGLTLSPQSATAPGALVGYLSTRPGAGRGALAQARGVVATFIREGPSADDLARAKARLIGRETLAVASIASAAGRLAGLLATGRNAGSLAKRAAAIEAVDAKAAQAAARRWLALDTGIRVLTIAPPS